MSGSVNKVTLIGNLARDPEVRTSSSGQKIINMTVVTSEKWKDKATGEPKERAEFHRCCIFNEHLANVAEVYLRKGNAVYLEGQLQTRKWTDQSGVEKYTTEVILSRFKGEMVLLGGRPADGDAAEPAPRQPARAAKPSIAVELDDDIPW